MFSFHCLWKKRNPLLTIILSITLTLESTPVMAGPNPLWLQNALQVRKAEAKAHQQLMQRSVDIDAHWHPSPIQAPQPQTLLPHTTPSPRNLDITPQFRAQPIGSYLLLSHFLAQPIETPIAPPAEGPARFWEVPETIIPPGATQLLLRNEYRAQRPPGLASIMPLANIPLVTGWNLVSLPEIPVDTSPAAVLASIAGNVKLVYAYDGCDPSDPWKLYDPNAPVASDLTAIDHTMGLWVEMSAADTLEIAGITPTTTTLQLCTGWNLIGYPAQQSLPVAGALNSITGKYSRVFAYDATLPSDPWRVSSVAAPQFANDLTLLAPGRGYWVLATEGVTTTLPAPKEPIAVSLLSHADGVSITAPVSVTAVITSSTLAAWRMEYQRKGDSTWTTFATGNTSTAQQVAASFDPTLLQNDIYELRFTATDLFGQSASASADVVLEGAMKIGLFTISFTDLAIPVVGIPIQIIRTYDSRDKRNGDFGIGWTLSVVRGRYTNNRKPGEGWVIKNTPKTSIFPTTPCSISQETKSHITEIRFSDTDYYRFAFRVQMSGYGSTIAGGCLGQASFVQIGGRPGATLEVVGDNRAFWQNGSNQLLNFETFQTYEPSDVLLTTPDGSEFELSLLNGLERIRDRNGNALTIGADGITHSSGKSITFTHDGQGRITRISDPMGNALTYAYDSDGDLVSVTNQDGNNTRFTYNADHYLRDITDPRGVRAARNEYNSKGQLVATVDADGHQVDFIHHVSSRQEVTIDRLNNVTVYDYDDRGNVTSQTDALGNTTSFIYDARNNKLRAVDPLGHTTAFSYDANNNLLSLINPMGHTTAFTYNARNQQLMGIDVLGNINKNEFDISTGNLLTMTDSLGNKTIQSYNAQGLVRLLTDGMGNITTFSYDGQGNLTQRTEPDGAIVTMTYDENGNLKTEMRTRTDERGNLVTILTTNEYDSSNRLIQSTAPDGSIVQIQYNPLGLRSAIVDPLGNRTQFEYDFRGNHIKTTYPDNTTELMTYNANNKRTSITDRNGSTTRFEYDAVGRLIRTQYPNGLFSSSSFDAAGRQATWTDVGGNITVYEYDANDRIVSQIDPLGNMTIYGYDAAGNVISIRDANSNTTSFEYDPGGRRKRTIYPDGSSTSMTYDGLARLIAVTDQAGLVTQFEYLGDSNELMKVVDSLGGETEYNYDEMFNRISQTDANKHVTSWAYDDMGRIVKHTLPLGMSESFTYGVNGNMLSRTDFNGSTTIFEYDVNNRLVRKKFPDGNDKIYSYTSTGQIAMVTSSNGVTSYTYQPVVVSHQQQTDNLGISQPKEQVEYQPTSVVNPDGTTIFYTYDTSGNRASVTIPSGTTTYGYDALDRLTNVTAPDGGVTTYTYDAVGNRSSVTYPNGTTAHYGYDRLNRLVQLENRRSDNSILSTYNYTLGPAGNRLSVNENTGRRVDYTYDNLHRLTRENIIDAVLGNQSILYEYDAVGNRITRTDLSGSTNYTYDANDRLLTEDENSYSYDANGNLITKTNGVSSTTYVYDFNDYLISMDDGSSVVSNLYNEDGIRVQTSVNGVVTNYLIDSNQDFAQVVEETDANNELLVSYIYGDDLISQRRIGNTAYYHYDGLGSVRGLTDSTEGVSDTYTYEAFGSLLGSSGNTQNNYLFAGEQFDPNTSLYYLRARYYNTQTGRFITTDPFQGSIIDPVSLHKYLYGRVDPVSNRDPSGKFSMIAVMVTATIIATPLFLPFGVFQAFPSLFVADYLYLDFEDRKISSSSVSRIVTSVDAKYAQFDIEITTQHPNKPFKRVKIGGVSPWPGRVGLALPPYGTAWVWSEDLRSYSKIVVPIGAPLQEGRFENLVANTILHESTHLIIGMGHDSVTGYLMSPETEYGDLDWSEKSIRQLHEVLGE